MNEAPPVGSIVVVVNWPTYNGLQYTVESIKDDFAFGYTTEGLSSAGVPRGHGCNFQFRFIEIVETKPPKKLGEAIVVFKGEFSTNFINAVNHLGEIAGLKFLRTYLNGRYQEYIYEVQDLKAAHALMINQSVKTFTWVPE